MKRCFSFLIVVALFSITLGSAAESKNGAETTSAASVMVVGRGQVYLYGKRQQAPYIFTNIGGDTLFLNGLPRYPLYKVSRFARLPKEEQIRLLAEAKRECTAGMQLADTLKNMLKSGMPKAEVLAYYVSVVRRIHPEITDVTMYDHSFIVHYPDGQIEEFVLPQYEVRRKTPNERRAFHEFLIERFQRTIESGGLAAYGVYADSLTYQLEAPKWQVELMEHRRLFAKLASGAKLTKDDVRNTPLCNEGFRRDIAKALRTGKAKGGGMQ